MEMKQGTEDHHDVYVYDKCEHYYLNFPPDTSLDPEEVADDFLTGYDGEPLDELFIKYSVDGSEYTVYLPRITDAQKEHIEQLQERARKAMEVRREEAKANLITIDDLFEYAPDGNFEWKQDEAGDWHVYNCGEKDCPIGWHKVAYAQDLSRENDKKVIELKSVDEDGDWDNDYYWESGEDTYEICYTLTIQLWEYFYGWFQYWADCALTGMDVLNEAGDPSVATFIKFAEGELKSLEK